MLNQLHADLILQAVKNAYAQLDTPKPRYATVWNCSPPNRRHEEWYDIPACQG